MSQYVIQVKNGPRWSLHSYKESESQAVQQARTLLKQKFCDEAQVLLKEGEEEKIVFQETLNSFKKKAGLGMLKSSPVFKTVDDLFIPENRDVLTTLLRDYCDHKGLSINELLMTPRNLENFMDDSLCTSALERLASLQAIKAGQKEAQWRDHLYQLLQQAKEKSYGSGYDEIRDGELNNYIAGVGDLSTPDVRYRALLSLSKKTMMTSSWEGKFSILFDLLGDIELEEIKEPTALFLDDLFSNMFSLPSVIQDMLGQQPDRYNAIDVLAKLCTARYEARKWDTQGLQRISALMRKLPMTKCRNALAETIEPMLRSRSSLTKGDVFEEKHAFKQLLPLFISKNGTILGGEGMVEALTICGVRSFNRDRSVDNPSEAINYILENLDAPMLQLRFLLTLSKSQFGKECADIVCNFLPTFMDGPEHIHDIVNYKLPLKRKIKVITDLQKSALQIKLPKNMQQTFVDWLDDLLFNYLDEERIIDKMDSPEETLFKRATSLLQFCASGLLIEGKTLRWVRERVQEHLRQPNFVEKFTEDIETTKKKELVITQLHAMLKKAGLQQ